jgi:hypothetical protein
MRPSGGRVNNTARKQRGRITRNAGWNVLRTGADTSKEIRCRFLRHQLAGLRRGTPRPRRSWATAP